MVVAAGCGDAGPGEEDGGDANTAEPERRDVDDSDDEQDSSEEDGDDEDVGGDDGSTDSQSDGNETDDASDEQEDGNDSSGDDGSDEDAERDAGDDDEGDAEPDDGDAEDPSDDDEDAGDDGDDSSGDDGSEEETDGASDEEDAEDEEAPDENEDDNGTPDEDEGDGDEDEEDDEDAEDDDAEDDEDDEEPSFEHASATNMGHSPVLGPSPGEAPATIIMFDDPSCPACAYFEEEIFPDLEPYIDAGELSVVWRGIPVIDDWSEAALNAMWATYERDVDAFWSLRDHLFERQDAIGSDDEALDEAISHLHGRMFLDAEGVRRDAERERFAARPAKDEDAAARAGVDATPYFYLFRDGEFRTEIRGAQDARIFTNALEL